MFKLHSQLNFTYTLIKVDGLPVWIIHWSNAASYIKQWFLPSASSKDLKLAYKQ